MANEPTYRPAGTNVPGLKLLWAQILPNGVGVPTIGENLGKIISSVTRTGVGVYAVVFNAGYLAAGVIPSIRLSAAADTQVQTKTFTVTAAAPVLTFTILTAGIAADVAANAGNIIELMIYCRDSSAQ
jgi:hypothetical protein